MQGNQKDQPIPSQAILVLFLDGEMNCTIYFLLKHRKSNTCRWPAVLWIMFDMVNYLIFITKSESNVLRFSKILLYGKFIIDEWYWIIHYWNGKTSVGSKIKREVVCGANFMKIRSGSHQWEGKSNMGGLLWS